ncbi:MAG TPA: pyridoxal phosphate-dependent aminotransferase [Thermoanaerobaculia bacterium]|nr:pyridoxal phosphate-dependent aminotransferase [Thermoanaerobaculia bacterium]
MFSRRAQWNTPPNRLAIARARHPDALDLTESNPTRAGIPYPLDEIGEAFARAAHAKYDPDPRGLRSAREALAEHLGCDAGELLITASTSEAYSFLFKLLTDPGDNFVTATPSYPLLEHLAQLELIEQRTFAIEFHRRWETDASHIPIDARTRAIVVVNPNNPTGSYVSHDEQEALSRLGIPIISDEVFLEYPLDGTGSSFENGFTLGGLSKSCGLPHLKLGWIRTKDSEALEALELIADNFLSVSTPVQVALPELLVLGGRIRDAIRERIGESLDVLKRVIAERQHAQLLPVEGGWSAVVRVPQLESDEEFALRALEEHDVIVHPGYFFDFARDGYFVVSLLTPPATLEEGISRIV